MTPIRTSIVCAALALACCAASVFAQAAAEGAPRPAAPSSAASGGEAKLPAMAPNAEGLLAKVVTPAMEKAIREGLRSLADMQNKESGSFGPDGYCVSVTALSGLALLASGSLPGSGPYGEQISRAAEFLLKNQDPNNGFFSAPNDGGSRIHGHGYALLFLSQLYGQSAGDRVRLRRALAGAVRILETGQTREGGWAYMPDDLSWDEGSTTICVLQALRSAQAAGISVRNDTIAKAIGYLQKIATPQTVKLADGRLVQCCTFMYSLTNAIASNSYALAAAACSCLNNVGVYSKHARWNEADMGRLLDGGMRWLDHQWNDYLTRYRAGDGALDTQHFFYANFYAAQACWQYSDVTQFMTYFPSVRDVLVEHFEHDGGRCWRHGRYSNAYGTAMALLVLQVPYQYLPAFQR